MQEIYSEDLEISVLETIINIADNQKYIKQLNSQDFYLSKHQTIFNLIEKLYRSKKPIDLLSIKELARSEKIDGTAIFIYLAKESENSIYTSLNYHINKLKNYSTRRQLFLAGQRIIKDSIESNSDEESAELKKKAMKEISDIKTNNIAIKEKEMSNIIVKTTEQIEQRYLKKNDNTYGTGFYDLDKVTDGLHEQEYTIIAARPGVGKTSIALNIAQNISEKGIWTYFVSLEMSETQLGNRMISSKTGLDSHKIRKGWLEDKDWQQIAQASAEISELKMIIDTQSTTIQDIENKAYELKENKNMGLMIIDYLQLLKSKEKFSVREQEVADISRKLKLLSRDLNIPIIALCQLNRETEKRRVPMLADLRESGSIEQDADNVILLNASEEEKMKQFLMSVEVIIAKQRNGPTGVIHLKFNKKTMTFQNTM